MVCTIFWAILFIHCIAKTKALFLYVAFMYPTICSISIQSHQTLEFFVAFTPCHEPGNAHPKNVHLNEPVSRKLSRFCPSEGVGLLCLLDTRKSLKSAPQPVSPLLYDKDEGKKSRQESPPDTSFVSSM